MIVLWVDEVLGLEVYEFSYKESPCWNMGSFDA